MATPMPQAFLHLTSGAYDLPAIMRRAWVRARNAVGREPGTAARQHLAYALRQTWDEARAARGTLIWQREQAARFEAETALDARTREIAALHRARAAADGIDNTRLHFAEVRAIETRLGELQAA